MTSDHSPIAQRMIVSIRAGGLSARVGYLVGLDRPALLSPDPAAVMAAERPDDILASGYRWRVVTERLWQDLLALGRERPRQQVFVVPIPDVEAWLEGDPADLATLEPDESVKQRLASWLR
ncbi:MAG TPA: hypothetical protein VHG52_12330, partial [Thermomicrobiales bacterium]|nr:hypothetical protein [Thermomicrobiales bacterium]